MEIEAGLVVCATGYCAKDLIIRVLGPTADYLGEGLKNLNSKIANNIQNICSRAKEKLGPEIENTNSVPPRVAKEIFENGGMCEDDLLVEYYSGLLASSRTSSNRDDRVLSLLSLLRTMSTYQIRTHYILYNILRSVFLDCEFNIQIVSEAQKLAIFVPIEVYNNAMEFSDSENVNIILPHSLNALALNNLIAPNFYWFGDQNFLLKNFPDNQAIRGPGLIVAPSPIGAELYLAVQGKREYMVNEFFSSECSLTTSLCIPINKGTERLFTDQRN